MYDWPNIRGIESIDGNPDATLNEIREAEIKYLTFHYTGAELNSLATNHILQLKLQGSTGQSGSWDSFVKINNIKVTQTFKNTTVPLARRDEAAYTYGYNGQSRTDKVSGSGNHYTAPFWEYDPRAVHRWNLDPKPNTSFSPYAIMQGNPIMYSDPLGDSVKNKYQAGAKYEGLKQDLKSNIKSAERGPERRAARQEYKANKSNFRLYEKFDEVDNIIGDFKSKNPSEFDRVNNLEFGGKEIDLIVGLIGG